MTAEGIAAPEDGTYTDGNLQLQKTTGENGQTQYDVKLNDNITLGEGQNAISLSGDNGTVVLGEGQRTIELDGKNNTITLNKELVIDGDNEIIHGLSNNNWVSDKNYQDKNYKNSTMAATEGQLYDVYNASVKYDRYSSDSGYNKDKITLEGTAYDSETGEGGTTITNVAQGVNDSDAVNVSQLKDVEALAGKHTIITVNGGTPAPTIAEGETESTYTGGNLQLKQKNNDGRTKYDVKLNDDIYLGGDQTADSNNIALNGSTGTISAIVENGMSSDTLTFDGDGLTVSKDTLGYSDGSTNISGDTITTTDEYNNSTTIDGGSVTTEDLTVNTENGNKLTFDSTGLNVNSGDTGLSVNKDGISLSVDNGAGKNSSVKVTQDGTEFSYSENGVSDATTTTIKGNTVTISSNARDDGKDIVIDGNTGTITGLSNKDLKDPTFATVGRAATEEQLQLVKDAATTTVSEGKNIDVTPTVAEDGHTDYKVSLQDEVKLGDYDNGTGIYLGGASGTISATGSISVGEDQGLVIDGNKKTINGLSNTTWDPENYVSGQAATEDQLKSVSDDVNAGWIATDNNGNEININPDNNKLNFAGDEDENVTVTAENNSINVSLNDKLNLGDGQIIIDATENNGYITIGNVNEEGTTGITLSKDGSANFGAIQINNETGENTITGLTNTEWSASGTYNSGRAATEEQLSDVADWAEGQINNSGWTVSTNNGDKTTDIKNGDTVDFSNTDGNIKVSQEVTEDGTQLLFDLNDKVNIGDKIELDGKTGNARFSSGDEAYVDIFGATGSMKLGNGSYSISIGGSDGTITGLTNTAWNGTTDDPSRAATEGQLQQAISNVQTEFQQNDQHLVANPDSADGNYFVDGKNQINLKVQNGVDENGNPKYDTVTIDNVAQASDVGDVGKLEDAGLGVDETTGESNTVDAILDVNDKVDNLGETISSTVGKTTISNDNNVTVDTTVTTDEETGMKTTDYKIGLNNDKITLGDETNNVTIEGTKGNISATGTISAGNASMSNKGFAIGDKTYITSEGINANGQKITNVAAGTEATDAVNVSQLAEVANNSYTAINNVGNQVNRLSNRIDKVGAGAAALAALHPLDFDPDDKLSFAAGYGNYAGENAVAVGAFYQPNEDTMFSVGGTFGNDENMVNAGVSFKLGQKSNVSRSRVSMAKELVSLRDEVAQLKALMAHAGILPSNGQLDTSDMFPDVPENHWAYEYIHELAKLGIVDGYPDGNFEGDRMMTRYEMAAIVYRAMQKGVNVDSRMLSEFEPELKLIRVDVVARDDDGNPTIERVRVNDDTTQA